MIPSTPINLGLGRVPIPLVQQSGLSENIVGHHKMHRALPARSLARLCFNSTTHSSSHAVLPSIQCSQYRQTRALVHESRLLSRRQIPPFQAKSQQQALFSSQPPASAKPSKAYDFESINALISSSSSSTPLRILIGIAIFSLLISPLSRPNFFPLSRSSTLKFPFPPKSEM